MTPLLLAVVLFFAPAPDSLAPAAFLAYDRMPATFDAIPRRFEGEEPSRRAFSYLLRQLGRPALGPRDEALMIDSPHALPVRAVLAACDSPAPLSSELVEIPQEDLIESSRGVWRSYVIVLRAGSGAALPDSGIALRCARDCVTLTRKGKGK